MPSDGNVKFPKSSPLIPAEARSQSPPPNPKDDGTSAVSCSAQVPCICHRLGFSPPRYVITPVLPNTPLWNGYADFGSDPRIEGKVGEVKDIYGRKNAKEEVAKLVLSFMKDIERQRVTEIDDEDKKRKRDPTSLPEVVVKHVKVSA